MPGRTARIRAYDRLDNVTGLDAMHSGFDTRPPAPAPVFWYIKARVYWGPVNLAFKSGCFLIL